MSTGPDSDDDPIEIELEPSGPDDEAMVEPPGFGGGTPPPAPPEFRHGPLSQAAAADRTPADDAAALESESRAHPEPARRAVLLHEVARLREQAGEGAAAAEAARAGFAEDPSYLAGFWALRRLLARDACWEELEAAYGAVLARASLTPGDRADLSVERGRVLEDRLDRDDEAGARYREALAADPDHEAALLCLYLLGARTGARDAVGAALAGLERRAATPGRRVALAAARARVDREEGTPAGHARALAAVGDALAAQGAVADAPLASLLAELEVLSREALDPGARLGALGELARRMALVDRALAAALLREQARLQGGRPEALETLREAARLSPRHPGIASALVELGERLDRPEVMAEAVAVFEQGGAEAAEVAALALQRAEALGRLGRHGEALAVLAAPGARGGAATPAGTSGPPPASGRPAPAGAGDPQAAALEAVLRLRARDLAGLADTIESETAGLEGAGAAWALTFAGATRQWLLGAVSPAEALYRRALDAAPGYRPAFDALDALLRAERRGSERAALLEGAVLAARLGAGDGARETELREELVTLYRDELRTPESALEHQRRLVALAPTDLARRVRLHDLELAVGAPQADTVLALATAAGDPAVEAALKVEAARLLTGPAVGSDRRGDAARLLREAAPADVTGLAAAALEELAADAAARSVVVTEELAARAGHAPADVVRALRFRLAHHQAAAGRHAEAIATLTPLRSDNDPLARALSWDLARRSGDAILEVAVLSDAADAPDLPAGYRDAMLVALGESLERAGDPAGAAEAYRRAASSASPSPSSSWSPASSTSTSAADAALGLLRVAAAAPSPRPDALPEALSAVAAACDGDPRLREAARREAALLRTASGRVEDADLGAVPSASASAAERAELAMLRWTAGVRRGDAATVAGAMLDLAAGLGPLGAAAPPPEAMPLLARAASRARLGGADVAEDVAQRVWRLSRVPSLAPALSDLPVSPGEGWPAARPDPRRARASRAPGALAVALDLETALDAERRGALGAALSDYGRVIAAMPERLEAWEGIRRVARAGGDVLGEARALARIGALVKTPSRAASAFSEGARHYEAVGHWDEAITLWGKAVEARPDDEPAYARLHELLADGVADSGRAGTLDRLLTHRLGALELSDGERVALLLERTRNRLGPLGDTEGAIHDFKRILKIEPRHPDALWELGQLALSAGEPAAALPLFERFGAVVPPGDDERGAAARLALASCYEATGRQAEAIMTLRRAAAHRPHDVRPLEELVELYLRLGEWRSAIETMRAWEPRVPDARGRAALHQRIGALLRDLGRDSAGAALSFRTAAELDPLGDGTRALVGLHDALDDARGARQTVEREITHLRQALADDPFDLPRLDRLIEFLRALRDRVPTEGAAIGDAIAAVLEVRAMALAPGASPPDAPPRALSLPAAGAFWTDLAYPGALGFLAEIWPHVWESALALYPAPPAARPAHQARVVAGAEPRLGWIEASATSAGVVGLRVYLAEASAPALTVVPVLEPEPALVVGSAVLKGGAEARFRVGRALALLRDRSVPLEWMTGKDLMVVFACAASLAGAAPSGEAAPAEAALKVVSREMSRRDRKALALHASRFGFETIDTARWQHGVLRTADRLGLVLAGDVAAAARAAAEVEPSDATAAGVRAVARARDLLAFALGDAYPALRREAGVAG